MTYTKQTWSDTPSTATPLSAARLGHIEDGIEAASNGTGSAATLTTARNIDGQAFNGSADITVIAPGTHAATSKTTPVDADEFPLVDSAASNVLKRLTFANLKATLATWLATLTATWANKTLTAPTIAGTTTVTGVDQGISLYTGSGEAGTLAAITNGGAWSDISAANDVVFRAGLNNFVITAKNATGGIVFATGAADSQKMKISNAGAITVGGTGSPTVQSGTGTPEGAVTAVVGSLFMRSNGGAGTCFYVKESGAGNTGWVAK